MKKFLLFIFLIFSFQARSQVMQITSAQATIVDGGINVNLQTGTGHGAGFLSNSYTVTGNVIDLYVCYWFDFTLPILFFNHDFFIPVSEGTAYSITIHIMMSQNTEICDNFANPANTTISVNSMANEKQHWSDGVRIFPNPSSGVVYFDGFDAKINRVEVYDVSGKRIKIQSIISENKIELGEFQDGIYFMKIETELGVLNRKLVLKR